MIFVQCVLCQKVAMPKLPVIDSPQRPKAVNKWHRAFVVCLIGFVVFCALFGLPVVGNLVMFKVYSLLGCSFGFETQPPCIVMGHDIGPRFSGYGVFLLGMALTPVFFVIAFWELLIAWVVVILFLLYKTTTWRAKS
jgi:hypothetical protein